MDLKEFAKNCIEEEKSAGLLMKGIKKLPGKLAALPHALKGSAKHLALKGQWARA